MKVTTMFRRVLSLIGVGVLAIGLALPAGAESGGGPAPVRGAAPSNDAFNQALVVHLGDYHGLSNEGATKQQGERNHAGNRGGASVWFKITPHRSGRLYINTRGSDFDTLLAVYRGGRLSTLTRVASNDDIDAGHRDSRVRFRAVSGVTYRIAVDGYCYGGTPSAICPSEGSIALHLGWLT